MESSGGDHGRGLSKPLPPWTTTPAGHNFSLGTGGCFPWPAQRSPPMSSSSCYTCGYCRREFRSAQALGGHMNVHRRDRARLRQQCFSAASAAHGPSSSNSSSLPCPGGMMAAHQHSRAPPPLPNLNFSPPHRAAADPVIYSFFSTTTTSTTSAAAVAKDKAMRLEMSLELGIGVCGSGSGSGSGRGGGVEEDGLDLELRLGCAWE